jgi:hypothetical protein
MDRPVPVLAKCKTDKSEHHQDGSGYHQPMGIFHRLEKRDHFRASARPANVAGLGLSVAGVFNVESQPVAFLDFVWIDACRLKAVICRNISGPPESSAMKPKPRSAFHIFNVPVAIALYFPFAFSPISTCRAAEV